MRQALAAGLGSHAPDSSCLQLAGAGRTGPLLVHSQALPAPRAHLWLVKLDF